MENSETKAIAVLDCLGSVDPTAMLPDLWLDDLRPFVGLSLSLVDLAVAPLGYHLVVAVVMALEVEGLLVLAAALEVSWDEEAATRCFPT